MIWRLLILVSVWHCCTHYPPLAVPISSRAVYCPGTRVPALPGFVCLKKRIPGHGYRWYLREKYGYRLPRVPEGVPL